MEIESLRISQKNKFISEILSLKKNIERCENSISDLRKTTVIKDHVFVLSSIEKNKELIQTYQDKIECLEDKLELLTSGDLDNEILSEIKENTNKVEKKNKDNALKKEKIEKNQEKDKKISKSFFNNERDIKYQSRRQEFSMIREYERLWSIDLPDYMRQKLKGMPNNHGYIWKGIWFLGEMSPVNGPCIMSERQRDATYIHEIFSDEHVVYRKIGNSDYNYQKEFVKTTPRRKL